MLEQLREERDLLSKLKESEIKRRREMGLFLPVEVAMTTFTALSDSIVRHVQACDGQRLNARELLAAIESDFRRIIGSGNHRPMQLEP